MEERFYTYEGYKPELCEEALDRLGVDRDYLSHHGRLGQRWYHRNGPPYPLDREAVSRAYGKGSGGTGSIKKKKSSGGLIAKHKAKQVHKQKVQAAERARQAKQQKAEEAKRQQEAQDRAEREAIEREEWRQDVLRKGDAAAAREHTDLFSTDEINQIINKYTANQRLNQLVEDSNKPAETYTPQPQPQQNVQNQQKKVDNRTRLEKIGDAVSQIQKVTGPVSQVASDAKKIYDAYNSIFGTNKNKGNNQQQNNTSSNIKKAANAAKGLPDFADTVQEKVDEFNKVAEIREKNKAKDSNTNLVAKNANYKNRIPADYYKKNDKYADNQDLKKINNLKDSGYTDKEIAKTINRSESDVLRIVDESKKNNNNSTYVNKPGGNRDLVKETSTLLNKNEKESKEYNNKFLTPKNKQVEPKYSSDSNKKASENLKSLQKANANNQKVVESVSNMISNTNNSMLNKNTNNSSHQYVSKQSNDSYLTKQSTEALQIMRDNLKEDIRSNTNKSYSNQQKVTLQDIEDILKDRKKR